MSAMIKNRQQSVIQAAAVYRESLKKNLQHRLEIARAQGDERLVRQIEAEANYLQLK